MPIDWEDSTTYQWIFQKGFAQGFAEATGHTARARMLSRLASKNFGTFADGDAVLHRIDDPARLERMAERIFDAKDWDDLLSTP